MFPADSLLWGWRDGSWGWSRPGGPFRPAQTAAGITVSEPPTVRALDLAATKLYCRVDLSAEDDLFATLIDAAAARYERVSERSLMAQTLTGTFDGFGARLLLPRPPFGELQSVAYLDGAGDAQEVDLDTLRVDSSGEQTVVEPLPGQSWPAAFLWPFGFGRGWQGPGSVSRPVSAVWTAGYDSADDVPADVKLALMRCVLVEYEMREKADEAFLDRIFAAFWAGGYR